MLLFPDAVVSASESSSLLPKITDDRSMRCIERRETLLMRRTLELKGAIVRLEYWCALDCRMGNNALKVTPIQLPKRLMIHS